MNIQGDEAKEILNQKNPGTFLLRFSTKKDLNFLSVLMSNKHVRHYQIFQKQIGEDDYYWIQGRQGYAEKSILGYNFICFKK